MNQSQKGLYLTETIRHCEQKAVEGLGMTEDDLMAQAGAAAFNTLKSLYPDVRSIAVFCGSGNNAGDGYVLANLAQQQGFAVSVYSFKAPEHLPVAARHAALTAIAAGVSCQRFDDVIDSDIELVVDALLGIGLQGNVHGSIAQAITLINESGLPVMALDIPSGLDADTGRVLGVCIKASVTTTFIARKLGLFILDGPDHAGKVVCHSLHLDHCLATQKPAASLITEQMMRGILAPRRKNSHKGMYGHVLIIGGGPGMPGAVFLAALAALRVGAGMVSIATWPEHAKMMLPLLPEAMIYAIDTAEDLGHLLKKASVCVVGPGLGENEWANDLFALALTAQLPLVIDASALHLLARHPQHDDNWVLTPHPGEAASLLACSTAEIQADRCKSSILLQQQYGGCVVLKGAGTMVKSIDTDLYLCTAGNPGMATAGMGDVLSGVIGGLLAQGLPLLDAAKVGVWVHACAGDDAVVSAGERGLVASDLMPFLRRRINGLG